jgi:hypothetical protein
MPIATCRPSGNFWSRIHVLEIGSVSHVVFAVCNDAGDGAVAFDQRGKSQKRKADQHRFEPYLKYLLM